MKLFHWLLLALGTLACAAARFAQILFSYDELGLPLPSSTALSFVPAAFFVLFFLLCLRAPSAEELRAEPFEKLFSFDGTAPLFLGICAVFVLFADAAALLVGTSLRMAVVPLFLAVSAAALLYALVCLRRDMPLPTTALLLPPAYLCVQLVFTYRECAKDPVLSNFYIELLALAALAWSFVQLAAFAFRGGSARTYLPFAMISVILSLTAAATAFSLTPALLYGGFALAQLAFMAAFHPKK